jgi:hypothetical protein
MYVKIITDLTTEPISLSDAKLWMRIADYTSDDTLITSLLKSSRILLEQYTALSFGTKTIEATFDITKEAEIPYGPVQSMTSVYRRENESWSLMTANVDYWIINDTIKVAYPGLYKMTYQAGYTTLPEGLKTDIKVITAWQYENRGLKFVSNTVGQNLSADQYPFINLLNSRMYRRVVI